MIPNHSQFIEAINEKKKVRLRYYSQADSGAIDRVCAPLDYGPGTGFTDKLNRYWLLGLRHYYECAYLRLAAARDLGTTCTWRIA